MICFVGNERAVGLRLCRKCASLHSRSCNVTVHLCLPLNVGFHVGPCRLVLSESVVVISNREQQHVSA